MRYEYMLDDQPVRGELDAETVIRFASAGIPLAILRRRHYRRGTEQHVGEYTDQEHEGMLALGWDLVKVLADGEDVAPEKVAAPPQVWHYSKLRIVRALIRHGQDSAFFDWLESDRTLKAQWDAASHLQSDDPVFGPALETFVGAVLLPPGVNVAQVLEGCRI